MRNDFKGQEFIGQTPVATEEEMVSYQTYHRVNGLFISLFIVLHMATHLSGLWGIDAYNAMQQVMRIVYRNTVVEPILLVSVVLQVGVGIKLVSQNFRRKLKEKWARRQALSGLFFLFFISQHLSALAMARWIEGLDTSFFWPASVMSAPPFYWYFAPYYFLGVTAMFVHLGCALRLYALRRKSTVLAGSLFWGVSGGGGLLALTIVFMLLGLFYDIELPAVWVGYLTRVSGGLYP
ncbi:MAG: succinate dehydrogenase/fumarate reductase cytochrome b subunit [Sneathiella sp.]